MPRNIDAIEYILEFTGSTPVAFTKRVLGKYLLFQRRFCREADVLINDAVYKFKRYEDASLICTGIDKHTGEDVGLYSTVISRADYDAMAGQLAVSMTADAPREDDLPERPVFINISDDEDDEEEIPASEEPVRAAFAPRPPIVQSAKPAASTYRPSYIPPMPSVSPLVRKPKFSVGPSKIHAGTTVTHKAFGTEQVKGIRRRHHRRLL